MNREAVEQAALADPAVFEGDLHFPVQLAFLDDEQRRHDLRRARHGPLYIRIELVQDLSAHGVDQDRARALERRRLERRGLPS